ncbi:MAG: phosphoribosylanthranilate isomerase [Elusimicrobiota bacterium]
MTLVKICGITTIDDRDMCVSEGADLLGFNLYSGSKRYVPVSKLKDLIVPDTGKQSVFVCVDMPVDELILLAEEYSPGYIQLHGNESKYILRELKKALPGVYLIKKTQIGRKDEFGDMLDTADYILCDTRTPEFGGSGRRFEWNKLAGLGSEVRNRLFVAGGIGPANVEELVSYDIYGIDIASGSEVSPGIKDRDAVRKIIMKVRSHAE